MRSVGSALERARGDADRGTELAGVIDARQRLEMQATENEGVEAQLKALKDGDAVYKRLGPALLPTPADEARDNVAKRLALIRSELERTEAKITAGDKALAAQQSQIAAVQQQVIAALTDQGSVLPTRA